jgi:hypothetical protein
LREYAPAAISTAIRGSHANVGGGRDNLELFFRGPLFPASDFTFFPGWFKILRD